MMEKFLTQNDLAARWGVSKQAVTNRKKNHKDFPKPAGQVGFMSIYRLQDVKEYEKRHAGERRGRKK